jgi:phage-related protein
VADIVAAMKEVARDGLSAARHLEGDIYEVRAVSDRQSFRILFAKEGQRGQVLLALEGFSKQQQKLPKRHLDLAKRRLADWRRRARG